MEVVFVRHPETQANVDKIFYTEKDFPYTERGEIELCNIVKELKNLDYRVFSSPYERALKVAQLLTNDTVQDRRLREIDFGLFKGLTAKEIERRFPEDFHKFKTQINTYVFPEGESYSQFSNRITKFFDQIIHSGENAIIITHAGVINYLLQKYFNVKKYWPKTGSIIKLKITIEEEHK